MAEDIGKGDWVQCVKTPVYDIPFRANLPINEDLPVVGQLYYVEDFKFPPIPYAICTEVDCREINEPHIKVIGLQYYHCPKCFKPMKGPSSEQSITTKIKDKEPEHA